jgi:transcriptional regulator with XRE-family HTH domain
MVIAMRNLKEIRDQRGLSQRGLAGLAGVSFRTLQMIEAGETDPRLSSLSKVALALGIPAGTVESELARLFAVDPDAVVSISRRICEDGEASWKLWLFDFVDAFRRTPDRKLFDAPPVAETSERVRCLLASTIEELCNECGLRRPWWCAGVGPLERPWFVAGMENLKATALIESPPNFRRRNIFVLANFLSRR